MTKTIPIAHYLSGNFKKDPVAVQIKPDAPSKEKESERKIWFEQGFEAGRRAALKECDQALEAERQSLTQHIAIARASWADTEGSAIVHAIIQAIHDLETNISSKVASILKPFIKSEALKQSIGDLTKAVHTITTNNRNVQLKITGPEDLVSEIKKQIPDTISVSIKGSDQQSVRIEAQETVIETNIDEWFQKLEGIHRA